MIRSVAAPATAIMGNVMEMPEGPVAMKVDEVIATLRAHERELKELGILGVAVFGLGAGGEDTSGSGVDLVVAFDEARGHSVLDEIYLQRHLTQLLGTEVELSFEPLHKARSHARVEQEQARAF